MCEGGAHNEHRKIELLGNRNASEIKVNGSIITVLEEYKYLGQYTAYENRQERKVSARIRNAWKSFWPLKNILKGNLDTKNKIKMFDSCVIPTLTYGAQTRALTDTQVSKICTNPELDAT